MFASTLDFLYPSTLTSWVMLMVFVKARERKRWEKSISDELKMKKGADELNDWDEETDDEEILFDSSDIDSSEVLTTPKKRATFCIEAATL